MNNNQTLSIEHKKLTYHPDIAKQFFTSIEQQPWAMLLRSASTTHMDSRFDILVANPFATLVTFGDETEIHAQNGVTLSREDPFALLADIQEQYLPQVTDESELPFVGGALGIFPMI